MRGRSICGLLLAAWLVAGCGVVPGLAAAAETPYEGLPGPAYYSLAVEPDSALFGRDIALSTHPGRIIRPRQVRDAADMTATGGASIIAIDGRLHVHEITLPPATLEATLDGRRCEGLVELHEDAEADVTLVIERDGCVLRVDREHPTSETFHRNTEHVAPPG